PFPALGWSRCLWHRLLSPAALRQLYIYCSFYLNKAFLRLDIHYHHYRVLEERTSFVRSRRSRIFLKLHLTQTDFVERALGYCLAYSKLRIKIAKDIKKLYFFSYIYLYNV